MLSRLPSRKILLSFGLGLAVVTWIGSTFVGATVAPIHTALLLNCDTCSAQVPFEGLHSSQVYASEADATAAAEDGSALTEAIRHACEAMNVHCRPCPSPSTSQCFPLGYHNLVGSPEWWVLETEGNIFVAWDLPAGSKVWVCCLPHCD